MDEIRPNDLVLNLLTDTTSLELSTWARLSLTTPSINPFHPHWRLTYTP